LLRQYRKGSVLILPEMDSNSATLLVYIYS
jgi:hypothetical protein